MTAESIAELLHARHIGPNRWTARCPSHADRHPSLSITQGERGVLLKCWAGCRTEDVLAAMGLTLRDLFSGCDLTPQQRAHAAQQSRTRDAERKAEHHAAIEYNRQLLRLECLRDALGAKLVRSPDDPELGRLFHAIEDKLHTLESGLPHHEDSPHRQEPAPETPVAIADALREVGQNFDAPNETARCERAA